MKVEELTPDDIDKMAWGTMDKRRATAEHAGPWRPGQRRDSGDLRIGAKLKELRAIFGLPRSTLSTVSGVDVTSITRIELGQRGFSVHSLTNIIVGARETVRILHPHRVRTFDKWAMELLEILATTTEEDRMRRRDMKDEDDHVDIGGGPQVGEDQSPVQGY